MKSKMALVARGQVGVEVWITSHDEFGDLARGLEQIIASQKAQVTGVMDEMAKGSDRQLEGVEHIRVAMEQVSHATQNVAASSEESAAAAEELQSQAEEMRGLVNSFHLSTRDGGGAFAKAS